MTAAPHPRREPDSRPGGANFCLINVHGRAYYTHCGALATDLSQADGRAEAEKP